MRKLLLTVCVSSLGALLAGCGSSSAASTDEFSIPDEPRAEIRAEYRGYFKDSDALYNYTERYIAKCMKNAGFDYEPELISPNNQAPSVIDETDNVTKAQVNANKGYPGTDFDGGDGNTENPGYTRTPASEKEAWMKTYAGEEKTDEELLESPEDKHGMTRAYKGGCANDAEAEQYGSLEKADQAQFIDSNLVLTGFNHAADDEEMVELNREWADCMHNAGFTTTSDGTELTEPALARSWAASEPEREFDIAMADATCQENMNYGPQRTKIEDRYLTAVADHYEGEIQGALDIRKEALERSKKEFG